MEKGKSCWDFPFLRLEEPFTPSPLKERGNELEAQGEREWDEFHIGCLTMVIDHSKIIKTVCWEVETMEQTIPISKFKATCLRLLDEVKKTGKSIVVTRKGEAIALISPPPPPPKPARWLGSMRERIRITGDVISPVVDENEWEALKN
jgi:prevent-host-death family protein